MQATHICQCAHVTHMWRNSNVSVQQNIHNIKLWGFPAFNSKKLCKSARAAIIKGHRMGGLHYRNLFLTVLEAKSPRSRLWQIWLSSGLTPWSADGCLPTVALHGLFSVCKPLGSLRLLVSTPIIVP